MVLDLNMGYYNIRIVKDSINLCNVIIPWGGSCYKYLKMVVSNSTEIFQQKMIYLFQGFEFICAYIYELLILTKVDWTDHVHKLEITFNKVKVFLINIYCHASMVLPAARLETIALVKQMYSLV